MAIEAELFDGESYELDKLEEDDDACAERRERTISYFLFVHQVHFLFRDTGLCLGQYFLSIVVFVHFHISFSISTQSFRIFVYVFRSFVLILHICLYGQRTYLYIRRSAKVKYKLRFPV